MRLTVLSDLHIQDADDPLYAGLLSVLKDSQSGDLIVLAGDVFDLFVGRKRLFMERYAAFFAALRECASRLVRVEYLEGNHDFLMKEAIGELPGISLHDGPVMLELSGKKFFISHGDEADREDLGYRALRTFFRSPVMKAFVALSSGALLEKIGSRSSQYSRATRPMLPEDMPEEKRARLRAIYHRYARAKAHEGFDFIVMGHCHDLDEARFEKAQYINVGFPRVHGTVLRWKSGESLITRVRFP